MIVAMMLSINISPVLSSDTSDKEAIEAQVNEAWVAAINNTKTSVSGTSYANVPDFYYTYTDSTWCGKNCRNCIQCLRAYGMCHVLTLQQLCYLDIVKFDKTDATTASAANGWMGVEPDFTKGHKKGAGGVLGAGLWTGGGNYRDGTKVAGDYTTYGITVNDNYLEKNRVNIDDVGIKRITDSGDYSPANYRKKYEPLIDDINKQFWNYINTLPDPCYNIVLEFGPANPNSVIFGHIMFIHAIMSDNSGTKYVYYNDSYSGYNNGYRAESLTKETISQFYNRYKLRGFDEAERDGYGAGSNPFCGLWHGGMYFEKQTITATPAVSEIKINEPPNAKPTVLKIIVNGKEITLPTYTINSDIYVKLRDVAYVLKGTGKQFNVTWDDANKISKITTMTAYVPVGGEMADNGIEIKTPWATAAKLNINGKNVSFNIIYVIDGNNYFKLDDLSKEIGLNVTYNNEKKAFVINAGEFAKPVTSIVIINGKETNFYTYEINGKTYFKLRDVAYALNETASQFSIAYEYPGIYIISANQEYIPVKNDMTRKSEGNKTARTGVIKLNIDGKEINLSRYSVNSDDYFDLIALGKEIGFKVEYNSEKKIYIIDTDEKPPPMIKVSPTSSAVLVNGKEIRFDAYLINDNNYFKLRDLAYALRGTEKQFSIDYDSDTDTILLTSGARYIPNGSEMTSKSPETKNPVISPQKVLIDGEEINFTAYNIGGSNYFKLRDIGETFDFGVDWDEVMNVIVINTN